MQKSKFHVDRLRGFWAAGPPKVPFPILIGTTLTTVLHYRADCDRKWHFWGFWLVLRGRHHQKSGAAVALPQQRVVRGSRVVILSRSYR